MVTPRGREERSERCVAPLLPAFLASLLALIALVLGGCGPLETRPADDRAGPWPLEAHATVPLAARKQLAEASDCCPSGQALPHQELAQGGKRSLSIDVASPVHAFASGKSHFAAYRIAELPKPALIEVSSYRSAEPGSLLQALIADLRHSVLRPTLLLLDRNFAAIARVDALVPRPECVYNGFEPAYRVAVLVPEDAAYLVITSSSESLLLEAEKVCGVRRHGLSAVGELSIETKTLPAGDLPLRMALPGEWHADVRRADDVGFWQAMRAEPRLLVLGANALHLMKAERERYEEIAAIAYDRLARVAPAGGGAAMRALALSALEPAPGPGREEKLRNFVFAASLTAPDGTPTLAHAANFLATRIAAGRARETVAWRVLPDVPATLVEGGAASRIAEKAVAAGIVAAMPCGLCQTGFCPPEVLGSCAVLFSVGALLGSGVGVVSELVSRSDRPPDARARLQAVAGGAPALSPTGLSECLAAKIHEGDRGHRAQWQDAGLSAQSIFAAQAAVVAPQGSAETGSPAPYDYLAEVALRQLVLAQTPGSGSLEESWRLHIKAELRFVETSSGKQRLRALEWSSEGFPLSAWLREDAPLFAKLAGEGCGALARELFAAAENAWRGR